MKRTAKRILKWSLLVIMAPLILVTAALYYLCEWLDDTIQGLEG